MKAIIVKKEDLCGHGKLILYRCNKNLFKIVYQNVYRKIFICNVNNFYNGQVFFSNIKEGFKNHFFSQNLDRFDKKQLKKIKTIYNISWKKKKSYFKWH